MSEKVSISSVSDIITSKNIPQGRDRKRVGTGTSLLLYRY